MESPIKEVLKNDDFFVKTDEIFQGYMIRKCKIVSGRLRNIVTPSPQIGSPHLKSLSYVVLHALHIRMGGHYWGVTIKGSHTNRKNTVRYLCYIASPSLTPLFKFVRRYWHWPELLNMPIVYYVFYL